MRIHFRLKIRSTRHATLQECALIRTPTWHQKSWWGSCRSQWRSASIISRVSTQRVASTVPEESKSGGRKGRNWTSEHQVGCCEKQGIVASLTELARSTYYNMHVLRDKVYQGREALHQTTLGIDPLTVLAVQRHFLTFRHRHRPT